LGLGLGSNLEWCRVGSDRHSCGLVLGVITLVVGVGFGFFLDVVDVVRLSVHRLVFERPLIKELEFGARRQFRDSRLRRLATEVQKIGLCQFLGRNLIP